MEDVAEWVRVSNYDAEEGVGLGVFLLDQGANWGLWVRVRCDWFSKPDCLYRNDSADVLPGDKFIQRAREWVVWW